MGAFYARLSRRERIFVEEYLTHHNAQRAALAAGYDAMSAKTADHWVTIRKGKSAVLRVPSTSHAEVALAIEERLAEQERRAKVSAERVLDELHKIAFSNLADFIDEEEDGRPVIKLAGRTRDEMAALQEVMLETKESTHPETGVKTVTTKVRIKLWDKFGALVEFGRHFGILEKQVDDGEIFEFSLNIGDKVVSTIDAKAISSEGPSDPQV